MNYYEHHLGDYLRDTAHLTMLEDGAYQRLLQQYYVREQPLPPDLKQCCKLARATSAAERKAVALVLGEFFDLQTDGYHQARADLEIARFKDKQDKARASAGIRWKKADGHANASPDAMRTHSGRNALQSPVSSLHSSDASHPRTRAQEALAGRAEKAWDDLISTDGQARSDLAQKAIDAIGGWPVIAQRKTVEAPKIRIAFIRAHVDAEQAQEAAA